MEEKHLDHMLGLCWTFQDIAKFFQNACIPFLIPSKQCRKQTSSFSTFLSTCSIKSAFIILPNMIGMKWYLIILLSTFPITKEVEHSFCLLLYVYVCSNNIFTKVCAAIFCLLSIQMFHYYWILRNLYIFWISFLSNIQVHFANISL